MKNIADLFQRHLFDDMQVMHERGSRGKSVLA